MMSKQNQTVKKQNGQAMTETLVTASTVLVPLLLLIPLLGKYIDIKHAAINAARYEAWEYTVWYGDDDLRTNPHIIAERSSGFQGPGGVNLPQPIKGSEDVQQESRRRFFSATDLPLLPGDLAGWTESSSSSSRSDETNTLWMDHRGNRLWDGEIPSGQLPVSSAATPDYGSNALTAILDMIDEAMEAISHGMRLPHRDSGFTAINTGGLAKSTVTIPVDAPVGLIDFATLTDVDGIDDSTSAYSLNFEAGAAVLTDAWNSGGYIHTTNQVFGITPSKTLKPLMDDLMGSVPGMGAAWNVVEALAPEWRPCNQGWHPMDPEGDGSLWLGYVNLDVVHPDRLSIGGNHQCPDGICNLSYQNYSPCN